MNKWTLTRKREQASERTSARQNEKIQLYVNEYCESCEFLRWSRQEKAFKQQQIFQSKLLSAVESFLLPRCIAIQWKLYRPKWCGEEEDEKKNAQNKRCSFWLNLLMCMYEWQAIWYRKRKIWIHIAQRTYMKQFYLHNILEIYSIFDFCNMCAVVNCDSVGGCNNDRATFPSANVCNSFCFLGFMFFLSFWIVYRHNSFTDSHAPRATYCHSFKQRQNMWKKRKHSNCLRYCRKVYVKNGIHCRAVWSKYIVNGLGSSCARVCVCEILWSAHNF